MDASRVIAVPGLGLGVESWRPVLAEWGVGEERVRLLPGYGLPVGPEGVRAPAELAVDLCATLTGPTTLLGHSASCQVLAHVARLRPDLVDALVLVGPATDPRARSWPALAALWVRTAAHEDPRQVPVLVRQYRRTTLRSMRASMDVARRDDLAATLAAVTRPVVLVRGAHDRLARHDWLRHLADGGPDRQVVEIGGGAHMVPMTHPGPVARGAASALSRLR
ncbi:alpha/beta fold hydrolase [Nocardioides sp. zg-DK7169]|uniref:alpha/beta fold hydrolase n=1 Tax=Nocardioides sp. zg-DK7169 TaxID=2736600 RepID=UPI0015563FDC|nr:alpha/beta hydrolase [Nocardioides sp. zg-DK7169]NPC96583.1 alpha/beta hydrolase [Nocardioides sp. zg-DK7169]